MEARDTIARYALSNSNTTNSKQCVGFALGVEYIGLARAASQLTFFIRKCLPENFMIPLNKEMEEFIGAAYTEIQKVRRCGRVEMFSVCVWGGSETG